MTRLAALHARITGDSSGFVTATQRAGEAADNFTGRVGPRGLAGATGSAKKAFSDFSRSPGMRMLPIQLSQVAQQAAAGGGVMRALSIQAADIGLAFGGLGVIVGTLATVAMPLLIGAFSNAEEGANQLDEALDALDDRAQTIDNMVEIINASMDQLIERFGQGALAAREFALSIVQAEIELARRDMRALSDELANVGDHYKILGRENSAANRQVRKELGLTIREHRRLDQAIRDLQNAQGLEAQIAASEALRAVMVDLGIDTDELTDNFLESAKRLDEAGLRALELQAALSEAQNAAAGLRSELEAMPMTFGNVNLIPSIPVEDLLPGQDLMEGDTDQGGGRRTGGGSRRDPRAESEQELERLRDQLMSEIELEREMHQERNDVLEEALQRELLTHQEFNDLIEKERKRHHEQMANLDVYRYGTGVQQLETFMGQMADAFATGNEEMMRISKVFGAAEALINAWRTFSQVMADETLPWFAKIPAAVSLFGSAIRAVSAIKGVTEGGGGPKSAGGAATGGGGAAPMQQAQQAPQRPAVNLTLIGDQGFSRAQIQQIAEAINDSSDDGTVPINIRGRR